MSVRLRVVFAGEALLDKTIVQYIAAVGMGEMTGAKAMEDLPALRWDSDDRNPILRTLVRGNRRRSMAKVSLNQRLSFDLSGL